MLSRRRLLTIATILLVAVVVVVALAPFLVATSLRAWAQRVTRREGLTLEIGQIDAPLFRPVVVSKVHLLTGSGAPFRVDCTASRMEFDLNLRAIFTGAVRPLRGLNVDGLVIDVRREQRPVSSPHRIPWSFLQNLLSDSFKLSAVQVHVENGSTTVDLRDGALSGSELETGVFVAREIAIAAPWFRQSFWNIKGATSWQETRLALGAVSLMRGLDLDTITIDLSRIAASQIGMEVSVDAFGGKMRARISSDDRGEKRTWDIAGNAAGVSLAQMSDALEWPTRASGSLHASRFTFRGEMDDLRSATASVWAEVTGLTWRDSTADTVMVGASLYNRELQVEQLYIKQRSNELTFNGEFTWPENLTDWIKPAFRGDISASINDLGDFARLFGQAPTAFAGKLAANGNVSGREGKFRGQLSASGNSLVLFGSGIGSLEMKLELDESRLAITQLELREKQDFLIADGDIVLTGDRPFNASVQVSVAEIADYRGFMPAGFRALAPQGAVTAEWKAGANSGTFNLHARNARLFDAATAPFEAELEAEYSPAATFFRRFHFWNSHADVSAFLTVAKEYCQVQELSLKLNGRSHLQGTVYLPVSLGTIRRDRDWLAALSADPFFDVDLVLDAIDLSELSSAVSAKPEASGNLSGHLQLSGTPGSLQGKLDLHARDFVFEASPAITADFDVSLGLGMALFKGTAAISGSSPLKAEGALPFQLERTGPNYALKSEGPLSASLEFPAIFVAKLPAYISRGAFTRGILSGRLTFSDSVEQPLVNGELSLTDAQLLSGSTASAAITFKGRNASIDFARFGQTDVDLSARGEIVFPQADNVEITLFPNNALTAATTLLPGDCVNQLGLLRPDPKADVSLPVNRIAFRGGAFSGNWTVAIGRDQSAEPTSNQAALMTLPLCREGKTLSLRPAPDLFP